uniref:Uncharacterized protein n=1 Tax=Amphimedon queenslandica TaxID=400682 RepID=A0A1X7UKD3_AMPQE
MWFAFQLALAFREKTTFLSHLALLEKLAQESVPALPFSQPTDQHLLLPF